MEKKTRKKSGLIESLHIIFIIIAVLFIGGFVASLIMINKVNPNETDELSTNKTINDTQNTYISTENYVITPDVTGMTEEEAEDTLEEANLNYEIAEESNKKVEAGYVISQETDAGEKVEAEKTIVIHVSTGIEMICVPSVVGKTGSKAKKELTDLGLKVITKNEKDKTKDDETVLKQSIDAGAEVEKGTSIIIAVNKSN